MWRRKRQARGKGGSRLRQSRCIITVGAVLVACGHLFWPALKVDAFVLALLGIAILPWLTPLIKSLELPGGVKLQFRELEEATRRAREAGLLDENGAQEQHLFQRLIAHEPNLALAGLRIEIEHRLNSLGDTCDMKARRPVDVGQLLRTLHHHEVLSQEQKVILNEPIGLLSAAVYGAKVDGATAAWAVEVGPRLLASLDAMVEGRRSNR